MQVGRSGYYAWYKRLPSAQEQANAQLTEQIQEVFADSDQTYGSPRIYHELKEQGIACSEKRIARLMFSRRVVGWAMGETLERSLVLSALDMAVTGRQPTAGLLCHSDRGSQYASGDYQQALQKAGAVCSMSRKGNCWDNAPTESFFASLKRELVHRTYFATRQEPRSALFRWIAVWYNRKRRHLTLGYLSPEAFERQYQQQQQQRPMAA